MLERAAGWLSAAESVYPERNVQGWERRCTVSLTLGRLSSTDGTGSRYNGICFSGRID
jgi:hypothetical protein